MFDLFYYTPLGRKHFASSVHNLQVYKKLALFVNQ